MPYVKKERRDELDKLLAPVMAELNQFTSPADFSYILISLYTGILRGNPNFSTFSDVMGVIETTKMELYRRLGGPLMDVIIKNNGDLE